MKVDAQPKPTPVREARLRKTLSQFEVAARSGLSLTTVHLAERTGYMSHATAQRLAKVLGVPVKDLRP